MRLEDPSKDWPYAVMQDLVARLRQDNKIRTAELLDDAALIFLEERRRETVASGTTGPEGSTPHLKLIAT